MNKGVCVIVQLTIRDKTYELNNGNVSLQAITDLVNKELENRNYYFSHFIVDQVDLYDNYEQYFEDNLSSIEIIEAVFKTVTEFVHESLNSMESYLKHVIPEIKAFIDELYRSEEGIGSNKTLQLLEGIQWIYGVIKNIDQIKVRPQGWNELLISATNLELIIKEMEEVFENDDVIVFADMLQYEIVPLLKDIQENVSVVIDEEGVRNGSN